MKKGAIYAESRYPGMRFFYKGENGIYEMFQTRWRKTVYEYFRYGKSEKQIHSDKRWHKHRFLSILIEGRLQKEIRRVRKEDANAG